MAAYPLLRIGWVSQRIQWYLRLFHLRQYFNGKKIRRILKLYGLFSSQIFFFFWSKQEFAAIFFRRVTAKIPDGKKNWLPVRLNGFCRRLNGFQNNRLTTGVISYKCHMMILFFPSRDQWIQNRVLLSCFISRSSLRRNAPRMTVCASRIWSWSPLCN